MPLFASLTGLENNQISIYMFASILVAMLCAWPIGWICDRVQRSYVLLVICLLAGLASAANALVIDAAFLWRLVALCALVVGHVGDEFALDLDEVDRQILEIVERREAGAEVIDGELVALILQALYELFQQRHVFQGKRIKWLILPLHESETDRHLIGLSG